ncbi:MAG: phospho-N-acetylmuramoyl-pentapeptide-transferase [Clostridia bacterium]|nr:phospho-N-acetylmuramoyl-pentapeptide-transferase [Clostridia bacterium]
MLALSPLSALLGLLLGFVLSGVLLAFLKDKLPQDHGRAYAVNGQVSKGKARGGGVVFIPVFAAVTLLAAPFSWERCAYLFLTLAAMLTGYLDDRADLPWGELKKGLLDLAICLLTLVTFMNTHTESAFSLFGWKVVLPWWLVGIIALFLWWAFINCCNGADGVDGHFGTLSLIALGALGYALYAFCEVGDWALCALVLMGCILAYLLFNASPSLIMMGDAGSRAIGLFMGILVLQTGNFLLCLPFAIVILLDGGLGLLKLAVMRTFHSKTFMMWLLTPLHDEARKKRHWSDTQTVFRFAIVQLICALTGLLIMAALR